MVPSTDWVIGVYQNSCTLLPLDVYVLDLEPDYRIRLDDQALVFVRYEGILFLGVLQVAGDFGVRDERFAGSDLDLDADALDAGDDAVEHLASQRPVDHRLEAHGEHRVAVVVDQALFDGLDPASGKPT